MAKELGSILEFLENKSILITGATGFLGKIFLEKILRVQPNVKKFYLLLRAQDTNSASQRFQNEIIGKDLFRVLKEKCGTNLNSMISEKISLVPGDISCEGFGLKDTHLRDEMFNELDVIINLAATTNFDERYDVALGINTLGAKHVLDFGKKCTKLMVLVHVSTAYVAGERSGLILETPYAMGESINGNTGLDIDIEIKVMEQNLNYLRAERASEKEITLAMKDLGHKRAKIYGWPNTYVFTKSMGEMLIENLKENIPVVILRPTIITSTYTEPFPGWVEGVRTIDSIALNYGKGRLPWFLGDPNAYIDAIPADMVVNSIIVAMVAHAKKPYVDVVIYQLGSSSKNPLRLNILQEYMSRYFISKPCIDKDGKPIIVGKLFVLNNMASFHRYMAIRYMLPLKGLELVNTAFCQYFQSTYNDLYRRFNYVMRLVELYRPYLFFNGVFDDVNTDKLLVMVKENGVEGHMFYFDPKCIDWEDYFINTHFPGVVKHVFKRS